MTGGGIYRLRSRSPSPLLVVITSGRNSRATTTYHVLAAPRGQPPLTLDLLVVVIGGGGRTGQNQGGVKDIQAHVLHGSAVEVWDGHHLAVGERGGERGGAGV